MKVSPFQSRVKEGVKNRRRGDIEVGLMMRMRREKEREGYWEERVKEVDVVLLQESEDQKARV